MDPNFNVWPWFWLALLIYVGLAVSSPGSTAFGIAIGLVGLTALALLIIGIVNAVRRRRAVAGGRERTWRLKSPVLRGALVVALILAAGYSAYVLVRGTITAAQGEGDPEVVWPALALIALITVGLLLAARRVWTGGSGTRSLQP